MGRLRALSPDTESMTDEGQPVAAILFWWRVAGLPKAADECGIIIGLAARRVALAAKARATNGWRPGAEVQRSLASPPGDPATGPRCRQIEH